MNIHEIYNILLAGKRLQLQFGSAKEAEAFRVRVAQVKQIQDKLMISIGMLGEDDRQKFCFEVQSDLLVKNIDGEPAVTATFYFKDKEVSKQYDVKILDDDET